MRTICIAPAGGGFDTGVAANGLYEKDIALTVALGVQSALEKLGVTVVMTRDSDVPAGRAKTTAAILENEVAIGNNASVELFLKLAVNSPTPGASATVYPGSSVEQLAHDLVSALQLGVADPAVTTGNTYVLEHTSAPAIVLHLGDLHDVSFVHAVQAEMASLGERIASAIVKDSGSELHAVPSEVNYAIDYQPTNATEASSEATIEKWAKLFGVPAWIAISIAQVESALDPNAKGDVTGANATSFGLFQLHQGGGQGDGYTEAQLLDPDMNCHIAISHMVQAFKDAESQSLTGYPLLSYVASHSGHPDETGFMPESYDTALKLAYEKVTGQPAEPKAEAQATATAPATSAIDQAIAFCKQHGIMTADQNGDFRPDDTIQRWQLAVVMERLYNVIKG